MTVYRHYVNVSISTLCPGPVDTEFNKVAGGTFASKGMSADKVAEIAVEGMFKGKMMIVPGLTVKLGLFFMKFIPRKVLLKYVSKFQKNKVSK